MPDAGRLARDDLPPPPAACAPTEQTAAQAGEGAVGAPERQKVLAELHSERFVDCAPAQVWATLLDEGRYLASERTMYRILAAQGEGGERRNQLVHPPYNKPELLAERVNEVWSWDISKLRGPAKWTYFYLYVILDVFSRYVVGWTLQHRESGPLAEQLIDQALLQQRIGPDQLTIHADRGSSMTSKARSPSCVADLSPDPAVSTDTFSEAHLSNSSLLAVLTRGCSTSQPSIAH